MISFSNIHKQYGKQLLVVGASFQLNPGEKLELVGPNGAGRENGRQTGRASSIFSESKGKQV
jgi:ABC-type lipopolysaccharide export system ATPase subunit